MTLLIFSGIFKLQTLRSDSIFESRSLVHRELRGYVGGQKIGYLVIHKYTPSGR